MMESDGDFMDGKSFVFRPISRVVQNSSKFYAYAIPRAADIFVRFPKFSCPFPRFGKHGPMEFPTKFLRKDVSSCGSGPSRSFRDVGRFPLVELPLVRYVLRNEGVEFFDFERGRSGNVFEFYCHSPFQLPLLIRSSARSLIARSANSFVGDWFSSAMVD